MDFSDRRPAPKYSIRDAVKNKSIILLIFISLFTMRPIYADDVRENEINAMKDRRGNLFDGKGEERYAVELGWRYIKMGYFETALMRFNQALLFNKEYGPAYFGIAVVYSVRKKIDLAIENYKESIKFDPTNSNSYGNLGLALIYSNKLNEAKPCLEKAIELDPNNGDAQINNALYYFKVKKCSKAWEHIHLAEKVGAKINGDFLKDLNSQCPT